MQRRSGLAERIDLDGGEAGVPDHPLLAARLDPCDLGRACAEGNELANLSGDPNIVPKSENLSNRRTGEYRCEILVQTQSNYLAQGTQLYFLLFRRGPLFVHPWANQAFKKSPNQIQCSTFHLNPDDGTVHRKWDVCRMLQEVRLAVESGAKGTEASNLSMAK